ncbi:MAG: galactose ABC transporter substrate-binding protein [Butyrivibrio sp.]|nr:galactose ABC transporter substrate-binding protein [Butyrivibrio sp.]
MSGIKKTVSLLLIAVMMVCIVAGCESGRTQVRNDKIKIGVSVYDQYDTFISQLITCLQDNVDPEEAEMVIYNASQSQQTQNSQVKKMIEDECDVICVNLVDRTDPTFVIDAARKNDVPIIFFNRELVEGDLSRWNKLFYVGADAIQSGKLEGEIAATTCLTDKTIDRNGDGAIQYVVLEGEAGHQDAIVRTEYSVDTLISAGIEVDKVGYAIANWNRAQAQTKMAQFIEQNDDDIEVVLSNNDDMALGAIDAYEASGMKKSDWPAIFGIDGTDVGLEAVRDDKMIGTVYNDKEGQSRAVYRLAVTIAKGGSIEDLSDEFVITDGRYIRLDYEKVTAANINKYIKR